eukprot:scaffold181199_cov16-Tisochrysis_lutea.AAC.1
MVMGHLMVVVVVVVVMRMGRLVLGMRIGCVEDGLSGEEHRLRGAVKCGGTAAGCRSSTPCSMGVVDSRRMATAAALGSAGVEVDVGPPPTTEAVALGMGGCRVAGGLHLEGLKGLHEYILAGACAPGCSGAVCAPGCSGA